MPCHRSAGYMARHTRQKSRYTKREEREAQINILEKGSGFESVRLHFPVKTCTAVMTRLLLASALQCVATTVVTECSCQVFQGKPRVEEEHQLRRRPRMPSASCHLHYSTTMARAGL